MSGLPRCCSTGSDAFWDSRLDTRRPGAIPLSQVGTNSCLALPIRVNFLFNARRQLLARLMLDGVA
jgi:hypothetical protein